LPKALKHAAASATKASEGERLLVQINQRFLDNDFQSQLALAQQLVDKYPRSARAWLTFAGVQAGLNQFVEPAPIDRQGDGPRFAPGIRAPGDGQLLSLQRAARLRAGGAVLPAGDRPRAGEDNYWWALGDVYRATNRLEEAREYYTRATLLDPHDGTAPVKLGHVDSFLGITMRRAATTTAASPMPMRRPSRFSRTSAASPGSMPASRRRPWRRWKSSRADSDSMDVPEDQRAGAKVFALTNAGADRLAHGAVR
jgi:tetratricopeptide (TPR) repeat protein